MFCETILQEVALPAVKYNLRSLINHVWRLEVLLREQDFIGFQFQGACCAEPCHCDEPQRETISLWWHSASSSLDVCVEEKWLMCFSESAQFRQTDLTVWLCRMDAMKACPFLSTSYRVIHAALRVPLVQAQSGLGLVSDGTKCLLLSSCYMLTFD